MKQLLVALFVTLVFLLGGCSAREKSEVNLGGNQSQGQHVTQADNEPTNLEELEIEAVYEGFNSPTGLAKDSIGNVYVSNWSGGSISKISPKGDISLFLTDITAPSGLAFGADGFLYVADYSEDVIYRVDTQGGKRSLLKDLTRQQD